MVWQPTCSADCVDSSERGCAELCARRSAAAAVAESADCRAMFITEESESRCPTGDGPLARGDLRACSSPVPPPLMVHWAQRWCYAYFCCPTSCAGERLCVTQKLLS